MRPDATRCLLLIDDEPAQRRLVTAIGARAGWWVMGAPDIEAAHKLLAGEEGREIDAILLDHWLEGEAGTALIADIRAIAFRLSSTGASRSTTSRAGGGTISFSM